MSVLSRAPFAKRRNRRDDDRPARPRFLVRGLIVVAAVLLLGVGWIVVTALIASAELNSIPGKVDAMRQALDHGDVKGAESLAAALRSDTAHAHARTTGPAWWLGSELPGLGAPLSSIRQTASAVDTVANSALAPALDAGLALSPDKVLSGPGRLDLGVVRSATAPLRASAAAVDRVRQRFETGENHTWLGAVDRDRARVDAKLVSLAHTLRAAADGTELLPAMLGADGPRTYFVAFMNEAEARGLGGLPGSYAILRAEHGAVHFTRFSSEHDLLGARSQARFGENWAVRYDQEFHVNDEYRNTTASPHFPYAAATWLSMWADRFGQKLDGAIAIDPTALGYLLDATGPVTLPDGSVLRADDVAAEFENRVYGQFPGLSQDAIQARKAYLNTAAQAIADSLTGSDHVKAAVLFEGLLRAVRERRLVAYSSHPEEQARLAQTAIAGLIPVTDQPYAELVINNGAGSKLDYYLARSLTYQRSTCASTTATVTVTLRNAAPASGLPEYLTYTEGLGPGPVGQNYELVAMYLTHGASLDGVTLDGKRQYITSDEERGHPVVSVGVRLLPGQTRTLVYRVHEPAASGPVLIPVQPLVYDQTTRVEAPQCGR